MTLSKDDSSTNFKQTVLTLHKNSAALMVLSRADAMSCMAMHVTTRGNKEVDRMAKCDRHKAINLKARQTRQLCAAGACCVRRLQHQRLLLSMLTAVQCIP